MPANLWRDLSPRPAASPDLLHVVVETPKRSRNKVEYDLEAACFRLDRVLYSSLHYPGDYGFVPQTLHDDGDPLDAIVLVREPTFPGCVIQARPVGVFHLIDGGDADDKILCVPARDPHYHTIRDLGGVAPHALREIEHFFHVYKDLEGKETQSGGWSDVADAEREIERAIAMGRRLQPDPEVEGLKG